MKKLALIVGLLLGIALPSHAAITHIAADCTGTTSCTTTGNAIGDLEVGMASRDLSTTLPTVPAGWTTVANQTINGTSTADSAVVVVCKVATGTSEASGTFTNAARLNIQVYRGQTAGATAACAAILGTPSFFATGINTTSTTETFNSVTNQNSSSWDVAFGYAPAATAGIGTAPASMTNRTSNTNEGGHDTNAGVSSYSTANVTLTTAGRIITVVVEIKAEGCANTVYGNWTCVQHPVNTVCNTGGTTCAVTTASTGTGHAIVVTVTFSATSATIASVSGGGTYSLCASSGCSSINGIVSVDHAYTLASTSGSTTTTVTASTTINNPWQVFVTEVSLANGTLTFDTDGVATSSAANPTGPTLTLTGSDDFITEGIATGSTASSISSSYNSVMDFGAGDGAAHGFSLSSGSAPTWTATSGTSAESALAIKRLVAAGCITRVAAAGAGQC